MKNTKYSIAIYCLALIITPEVYGLTVSLGDNNLDAHSDGYAFLLQKDFLLAGTLEATRSAHYPNLEDIFKKQKFTGDKKEFCMLTGQLHNHLTFFMFYGIGKNDVHNQEAMERIRRVTGELVKTAKKNALASVTLFLPENSYDYFHLIKNISIAAYLADYEFNTLKNDRTKPELELRIAHRNSDDWAFTEALNEAKIISSMVNQAREWGNLPANILTPQYLANEARRLASNYGCTCYTLDKNDAAELGMGGFLAVGQGAASQQKFIVVEYKTEEPNAPTIALVGKGIIFDTGGLNIKTQAMRLMKFDMCGGAAALATTFALAQLRAGVNVVAIVPAVENSVGSNSYRPSDIIRFMNGKTAEIINTDAEGRLVLADGLCYAEKFYNPDIIIDIATLTGACIVALGHFHTGLFTRSDQLSADLYAASQRTGDRVWRMPLHDDYKAALDSDYADFSNLGKPAYSGGSIIAAHFLENFVDNAKWAHLDIASTAFDVPDISYLNSSYATGASIRLLVDYIINYQK